MKTILVDGYAYLNMALCLVMAWICVCRIHIMTRDTTRMLVRILYGCILAAVIGSAISPWAFGEEVGLGTLLITCSLLGHLLVSASLWRAGVPDFGRTDSMPLSTGGFRERRKAWR